METWSSVEQEDSAVAELTRRPKASMRDLPKILSLLSNTVPYYCSVQFIYSCSPSPAISSPWGVRLMFHVDGSPMLLILLPPLPMSSTYLFKWYHLFV